jgi:hypothetical protein
MLFHEECVEFEGSFFFAMALKNYDFLHYYA